MPTFVTRFVNPDPCIKLKKKLSKCYKDLALDKTTADKCVITKSILKYCVSLNKSSLIS